MTEQEKKLMQPTIKQLSAMGNYWYSDNYYKEVLVDEWLVAKEFPFAPKQQKQTRLSEDISEYLNILKKDTSLSASIMKQAIKSNLNSMYGTYGTSRVWETIELYEDKVHKFLESAECRQKELLVDHYNHKISKMSPKKKEEIETLKKVVKKLNLEINEYIDAYPERYL